MAAETFTTRYLLDDSGYQAGANRVVQASQKAAGAAQSAAHKAKGAWGGGGAGKALGLFEDIGEFGGKIAGLFGAATIGVAAYALKLATSFDTIERSFLGVLGSWDKVKAMMDYLVAYSGPSLFEVEPLAQAASLLARIGLDVQRFLPIAEMLAIGGGNITEGGLADVIGLLMRAKGGQLTEATGPNEGVGRFGISRTDLSARGAQFDKQNRFVGTVEDFFDILERTVKEKLGGVRDAMAGGIEATWSSALTELKLSLVDVGKVIAEEVTPFVQAASKALKGLRESGVFTNIAKGFMSNPLIQALFNPDPSSNPLIKTGVFLTTAFEHLPSLAEHFISTMIVGLNSMIDALNANPLFTFGGKNKMRFIEDPFHSGRGGPKGGAGVGHDPSITDPVGDFWSDYNKRLNDLKGGAAGSSKLPQAPFTGDDTISGAASAASPTERTARATREIADNTAKQLDLSKRALGGGDLGRIGLTGEQLQGITNHKVTVKVEGSFAPIINEALRKLESQGYKLVKA